MVWVGRSGGQSHEQSHEHHMTSGDGSIRSGSDVWHPSVSLPSEQQCQDLVNFDMIIKNIKELNILAGEGSSEITRTPKGAKLKVSNKASHR